MDWVEKTLKEYEPRTRQLAKDLAKFKKISKKEARYRIFGKPNSILSLIPICYQKKYLIKKIGIKYYLFFWKRKLYLQKQIYSEITNGQTDTNKI